ncbi:uncharacterized protein LOC115376590 [Myripristis murdjan]|uniref:uncharacterized protein LOC115376590 n=1 Tax=Myripristis murdjan TaxID=586833 RepID=UPI00117613B9|nr:uncharacterized protein LOC115376590 [Myripristis murdjan]
MFGFYLLLVPLIRAYDVKPCSLLYANLGDNVTIPCFCPASTNHVSWYKQAAGGNPQIISYSYFGDKNNFQPPFKDSRRFSVDSGKGFYHLKLFDIQQSDSATYYCARTIIAVTEFGNGTFLALKEPSHTTFLQPPVAQSVRPGDSVTVNCTVPAALCDGPHSMYWFRHDAGDSHLEIIHTNNERCGRCERSFDSECPGPSCKFSLPKRNVSLSDAGTYYCAVASRGGMLFGGGMRLDVGKQSACPGSLLVLIYCLSAALLVSFIVILIMACILYKMTRTGRFESQVGQLQQSNSEYFADNQSDDSAALQYVALDFKKRAKARRQKGTDERETIYAGVRQTDED